MMRGGTGESKFAVRRCSERKSFGKTGKELSWQGEEHAKLEMREFKDGDSDRNHSSMSLRCIENSCQFSFKLIYNYWSYQATFILTIVPNF